MRSKRQSRPVCEERHALAEASQNTAALRNNAAAPWPKASTDCVGSSFGSAIKARRVELGLTQCALAERLNTAPSYISRIEHDRREPSLVLLIRIAETLQLKPEALFRLLSAAGLIIADHLRSVAEESRARAWERFLANNALLERHRVTARELRFLRHIRILGTVAEPNHFLFILKLIRQAQQEEKRSGGS